MKQCSDNKNPLSEIKDAFKYIVQSSKGKYSIESYLETLGAVTDDEIKKSLSNGDMFCEGEVTFFSISNHKGIKTCIEMKFYNEKSKQIKLKRAERLLDRNIFTDAALKKFDLNGELSFEIKEPRRS